MIVIATPGSLSSATVEAWRQSGIEIIGPLLPESFRPKLLHRAIGVAIDVMEPPEEVFPIVVALERMAVPHVFVVLDDAVDGEGSFQFGSHVGQIGTIINTLVDQQSNGVRH